MPQQPASNLLAGRNLITNDPRTAGITAVADLVQETHRSILPQPYLWAAIVDHLKEVPQARTLHLGMSLKDDLAPTRSTTSPVAAGGGQ